MVKRISNIMAAAAISLGLCLQAGTVYADEGKIEQVYVNMPEISVYAKGISAEGAAAYLGNEKLTFVEQLPFADASEPVYYYVLLDVSNSMPEKYFNGILKSITAFDQNLGPDDRMALYTFGKEVTLQLPEDHDKAEAESVIQAIDNIDNRTLLFEAIRKAADRASQIPADTCRRRVLLVISDGEDITDGGTGAAEALNNLQEKGIPVYAFAISDTKRENKNNFGEFARQSGGTLTVFDAKQAGSVLDEINSELKTYDVMRFSAENNYMSNQKEVFSVSDNTNQNYSREVLVNRHIEDKTAPMILSVETVDDNQISVIFSEEVTGADQASSYQVIYTSEQGKEEQLPIASVNVLGGDKIGYYLTFNEALAAGTYKIRCQGVTDISMEKNRVEQEGSFQIAADDAPVVEEETETKFPLYLLLIPAALVLAGIAGIAAALKSRKKKQPLVHVDQQQVQVSPQEVHQHIVMKEPLRKEFTAIIRVNGSKPEELREVIESSFIVGRSHICNLYFDDTRMSRQHFALEWDGTDFYVSDLQTTNGTMVNGVPVTSRRKIGKNDRISAGSVEMTIRW